MQYLTVFLAGLRVTMSYTSCWQKYVIKMNPVQMTI